MHAMTLKKAGICLHGQRWQNPLAKQLGVNPRTMRGWMQIPPRGPIPDTLAGELTGLLEQRRIDIDRVMPELLKVLRPAGP